MQKVPLTSGGASLLALVCPSHTPRWFAGCVSELGMTRTPWYLCSAVGTSDSIPSRCQNLCNSDKCTSEGELHLVQGSGCRGSSSKDSTSNIIPGDLFRIFPNNRRRVKFFLEKQILAVRVQVLWAFPLLWVPPRGVLGFLGLVPIAWDADAVEVDSCNMTWCKYDVLSQPFLNE